jgi:hypothetical protein
MQSNHATIPGLLALPSSSSKSNPVFLDSYKLIICNFLGCADNMIAFGFLNSSLYLVTGFNNSEHQV